MSVRTVRRICAALLMAIQLVCLPGTGQAVTCSPATKKGMFSCQSDRSAYRYTFQDVTCVVGDEGVRCYCKPGSVDDYKSTGYDHADPACVAVAREAQRKRQEQQASDRAERRKREEQSPWWVVTLHVGLGTAKVAGKCGKSAEDPVQYAEMMRGLMDCQLNNDPVNGLVVVDCANGWGQGHTLVFARGEAACNVVWARFQ